MMNLIKLDVVLFDEGANYLDDLVKNPGYSC